MSSNGHLTAAKLRSQLSHPIVDADGHWLEFGPIIRERIRKIGGDCAADGFGQFGSQVMKTLSSSVAERRYQRIAQEAFWALPTKNTRDRATATMPRLLYERMEELGLDFTILYPTAGLGLPRLADTETRKVTCRAFNTFSAEFFQPFADRMTPAAVIPMNTPKRLSLNLSMLPGSSGSRSLCWGA